MLKEHKFLKKIFELKVESFKKEILNKIDFYLLYDETNIRIKRNEFNMVYKNTKMKIIIEDNEILYELQTKDNIIRTKYIENKNGIFIISNEKISDIYKIDNNYSKAITTKEIFREFDKNGIEIFKKATIKLDNYQENINTGEITLNEPNVMENYTESYYKWRKDDNYILQRFVRKYVYPDGTKAFIDLKNSDNFFIRISKINSSIKEIPDNGEYYGIDYELALRYLQNEVNIDDIISNFHSKKYRSLNTIYL